MSTTTEQNKAVIRRFFEAWNSRRPEAFDELAAPTSFAIARRLQVSTYSILISSRNF
jgi:hypothetical protein